MEQKNRFSVLLEQLMSVSEIKNSTLAQELQYDVSYISKWVSGRMIPAEKTISRVLQGISRCIVGAASPEGLQNLMEDYRVDCPEELEQAIYDNLEMEYQYAKEQQKNGAAASTPNISFYPELSTLQFIAKMHHPVLRRVKSLDIMASMDIMSVAYEQRIKMVQVQDSERGGWRTYPNVHYSLLMTLDLDNWEYIRDTIFIINMLYQSSQVDFRLYCGKQAAGRIIFAVKDDFFITGILNEPNQCLSVVSSEDPQNSNLLYHNIAKFCGQDNLMFRQLSMDTMLLEHEYVHSLISPVHCWLMGHVTEHLIPEEMVEDLLRQCHDMTPEIQEQIRGAHRLVRRTLETSQVRLMIYESALAELMTGDEIDFYGYSVKLTPAQRIQCLRYILAMATELEGLSISIIFGRFVPDFQDVTNQCVFLSNVRSYIRLKQKNSTNVMLINHKNMREIFQRFFEEIWDFDMNVVISDPDEIEAHINHTIAGAKMLTRMETVE